MEHLRRFTLWFVSGFGAALGVAIVVYAFGAYMQREQRLAQEAWLPSTGVEMKDVEPIPVAKEVTVAATMTNNTNQDVIVDLDLNVSQGEKLLYSCSRSAPRTPGPGKSVRVQVSCPEIDKRALPNDVSYSIKVGRVHPLNP